MTSTDERLVSALSALAQDKRLKIFKTLVKAHDPQPDRGGLPAGALANALDVSASSLSFHLKEMQWNNLVTSRKEGRSVIYKADLAAMRELVTYLLDDCCGGACGTTVFPAAEQ